MSTMQLAAPAARTSSGAGPAINTPAGLDDLAVYLDVTAASGTTPSLTVSLEWSHDGSTWFTSDPVETFTAQTAAGKRVRTFGPRGDFVRAAWTITGTTPSFTFAVLVSVSDFG